MPKGSRRKANFLPRQRFQGCAAPPQTARIAGASRNPSNRKVSPLAGTVDPSVYKDAVVVLATAGVVVPLAKSLKVNSIIAFIACGALLGPFGLGGLVSTVPLLSTITVSNLSLIHL